MVRHEHLDDESFLRRGLAALRPDSGATRTDPCLDGNQLAGLAEGRLLVGEKEAAAAHLAACDACRALALRMAQARSPRENRPNDARLWPQQRAWRKTAAATAWYVAAAAILVGGIVWAWRDTPPVDVQLVAQAERLRRLAPDLLADFAPLGHDERLRSGEGIVRGGPLRPISPAATILETRPALRWESPPGSGRVTVSMRAADGSELFRATADGQTLAYPSSASSLMPGTSYEWLITDARGLARSEREFRVADEGERDRFLAGLRAIRASAPPELAELLCAHFALRRQVLSEAEAAARRALGRDAQDRVARETLHQVLVRLGSAEAGAMLAPENGQ